MTDRDHTGRPLILSGGECVELKGGAVGHLMVLLGVEKQSHRLGVVVNFLLGAPMLESDEAFIVRNRRIGEIDPPLGSVVVSEGTESGGSGGA